MNDDRSNTLSEGEKELILQCFEGIEACPEPEPRSAESENQIDFTVVNAATIKPIAKGKDETELLKDRYLCQKGILLLAGPTGIGKSSFTMQCLLTWGMGQSCFGITPRRKLRSLLIQAENDEGDIAEEIEGVTKGLGLTGRRAVEAKKQVDIVSISTATGEKVAQLIKSAVSRNTGDPYDFVVIDPVFAFLGGDASSQETVSRFLRNTILPCINEACIGCIIVHHTNKPLRAKDKDMWQGTDLAYLSAGSAEWANAVRAVLGIKTTAIAGVFELIAPKRGNRLGWKDGQGQPAFKKLIAHSRKPGEIFWREADADEIAEVSREKGTRSVEQKIANLWNNESEQLAQEEFLARAKQRGVSKSSAYNYWKTGAEKGVFKLSKRQGKALLTGKFKPEVVIVEQSEDEKLGL